MAPKKKLSAEEAKAKKKEYDKKRREAMKNDPDKLKQLQEKEREKYLKKKEKGQVKPASQLSQREKRTVHKKWKENSRRYRQKKKLKNITLPSSIPSSPIPCNSIDGVISTPPSSSRATVGRKRVLKNRSSMYRKIIKLSHEVQKARASAEKYKKRYYRLVEQEEKTPEKNVRRVIGTQKVSEKIKKKLLFCEVLTKQLKQKYKNADKDKSTVSNYYKVMKPDLLKKYRVLNACKDFFDKRTFESNLRAKTDVKLNKIAQDIKNFLESDENSRMCPGKRDFVKGKGEKVQKRLLSDPLTKLHEKFLKTISYKLSYNTFCRLRPFWIVSANVTERETCKCVIHANAELYVKDLYKHNIISQNRLPLLLNTLCCDIYKKECLFRDCHECKYKKLEYYLKNKQAKVDISQWVTSTSSYKKDGKLKTVRKPEKKEQHLSASNAVAQFENTLPVLLHHLGCISHQYKIIADLKRKLTDTEALIHIDFSENYSCKYHEEIQSVHFGGARQQVTLHTGVLYTKNGDDLKIQSFCTVSTSPRHDAIAVWVHLKPIIQKILSGKNIKSLHLLSDSPVTQYKNKIMFFIISKYLTYFISGIEYFSWHYSEPGHGKGAPDGIGGTVKRTADMAVAEGKDVTNIKTMVEVIKARCPKIYLHEISLNDITKIENKLDINPKNIKTFKGTRIVKQVVSCPENKHLEFRSLSCLSCKINCSHYLMGFSYEQDFTIDVETMEIKDVENIETEDIETIEIKDNETIETEDIETNETEEIESIKIEDNRNTTNMVIKVGTWVVIEYDSKLYPGEIISDFGSEVTINCMEPTEGDKFKWPIKEDLLIYPKEKVLRTLLPPEPCDNRLSRFKFKNFLQKGG